MSPFLLFVALAATSLANPVIKETVTSNSTLSPREVESGEHPVLQINTYSSNNCKDGTFQINDAQYDIKQRLSGTNSYWISRDLSPGESLNFYKDSNCFTQDIIVLSGRKYGCTTLSYTNHCYQLTYTSPAPHPATPNVNQVECTTSYDGFTHYTVRGKNFPTDKMGLDGSKLHEAFTGCLGFKDWYFEMDQGDPQYQWNATFTTDVGKKNCVGKAIMKAGGATDGGCHGAG